MPTYEQNKEHIYKYRITHADAYKKYTQEYAKKYNETNRDLVNKKALGRYYYNKEAKIFRNILIL